MSNQNSTGLVAGTIASYDPTTGTGFITFSDNGAGGKTHVSFHHRDWQGGKTGEIKVGQNVLFDFAHSSSRAVNISAS